MTRRFEPDPKDAGIWRAEDGATISKVNPRGGTTLYAVRVPGSRRPVWKDTLAEAKRYGEEA